MIKRQLKKVYKSIRRTALEKEQWQIAIRRRADKPLYMGNSNGFLVVPNSVRYWYADPFLYEKDRQTFLFAEMYDRYTEKGVLGVARVKNSKVSKFKVCLDLPHHLSYPYLYEEDETLYMIPESRQSNEVAVYKCIDFPYKWEKHRTLAECTGVDTTAVPEELCGEDSFYITTINNDTNHNNNLFLIDDNKKQITNLVKDNTQVRCAGCFVKNDNIWLRPAQDDTQYYGCKLVFYNVDSLSVNGISEEIYAEIFAPDVENKGIAIKLDNQKKNTKYIGVHTYNISDTYEVIDLVRHNSRTFKVWLCNTIKKMRKK